MAPRVALREKPTGRNLEDEILYRFLDGLDDEPDIESPGDADAQATCFPEYRGKPLEFCKDKLGIQFTEDVEDMILSVVRNPSTLAKSANGVGKTFGAACVAVYFYLVYHDAQVYTAAAPPEDNLKLLLWGEIGALIEAHPELFEGHLISLASLSIRRSRYSKSFMVGLAIPQAADPFKIKARFSGKHAPHMLFIFDEGDGVPKPVYEATETCMSGGYARELILFNPRNESGPVFQKEQDEEGFVVNLTAFNHPNVITGEELIPGAVDRETTVRRIMLWTVPVEPGSHPKDYKDGGDCFRVPKFLVGHVATTRSGKKLPPCPSGWRRITEPEFWYAVLGEYPAQAENQLISRAWVDAAMSRHDAWVAQRGLQPPPGIRPEMGMDVAELGQDSNCVSFKYGVYVAPQILWSGVDTDFSGTKAADLYLRHNAVWAKIDSTGIGSSVAPKMRRRGCKAYRIMVRSSKDLDETDYAEELGEFDYIRSQMLWGLREWLRTDPGAMLPNDPLLREELLAPTYGKNTKDRIAVSSTDAIKEKIGRSPDRLMSLALIWAKPPTGIRSGKVRSGSYAGFSGRGKRRKLRGRANAKPGKVLR